MGKGVRSIGKLPLLSEVIPEHKMYQCSCGSRAFFDWGLLVMYRSDFPQGGPRMQDWGETQHVKICAKDLRPVVVHAGDLYDASEYVSTAEIADLIQRGQTREHLVPAAVMDP